MYRTIRAGVARTDQGRRGPHVHGRSWSRPRSLVRPNTFKRTAVIVALNRARFSLAMAGRIAYFCRSRACFTPSGTRADSLSGLNADPNTGLPLRIQQPKDRLVRSGQAPKGRSENDWLIEIYEDRFVGIVCGGEAKDKPSIYGDLRDEGTSFISWFPFHGQAEVSSASKKIARGLLPTGPAKLFRSGRSTGLILNFSTTNTRITERLAILWP